MSRHRRFSAVIQDGKLTVSVVRVVAENAAKARAAAMRKAEKEARTLYPDETVRKLMTRDKFSITNLFEGHVREIL